MVADKDMCPFLFGARDYMKSEKFMYQCFMCGRKYQFGPHKYDGKHIPQYKIDVCLSCYKNNWDGWAPHYEKKLISHLEEKRLPIPKRNKEGWFPRE
ncbi:MAG: hypothetical protein Q7K21_06535 [Elusimicrobiota bacterium]|nr:hypothetical protein [Elusimicrobiota bacterium]